MTGTSDLKIESLLFEKTEEAFAAAESGRCDGYSDDTGSLAAARSTMKKPDDWDIRSEDRVAAVREDRRGVCRSRIRALRRLQRRHRQPGGRALDDEEAG